MTVAASTTAVAQPVLPPLPEGAAEPVPGELTFGEFLAALNPLHHLPVVGTIYRAVTGETIQPALRVLGGGILGGPLGMLSTAVLAALEEASSATAPPPSSYLARAPERPNATG